MTGPRRVKLTLGLPEIVGSPALPRRLAWLTGARLLFMSVALALVGSLYLGGRYEARYAWSAAAVYADADATRRIQGKIANGL